MNDQLVTIVVALISVVGGAGFWGWMQNKSKLAHDARAADNADKNEFRETLKVQVDRLADQVNQLVAEKEKLLREMAELQATVAAQAVTIQHLEERLRNK
jgi:uncharacterized protein HemX